MILSIIRVHHDGIPGVSVEQRDRAAQVDKVGQAGQFFWAAHLELVDRNESSIEQGANRIQTGEDRILAELARLHERLKALEKQLSSITD